jgi:hypothetical protein
MAKEFQRSHPGAPENTPRFSQDVHDFLVLQRLIRQPDTPQRTRNALWLVQETLIHRIKRDERWQLFSALDALRRQRSRSTTNEKEASGA